MKASCCPPLSHLFLNLRSLLWVGCLLSTTTYYYQTSLLEPTWLPTRGSSSSADRSAILRGCTTRLRAQSGGCCGGTKKIVADNKQNIIAARNGSSGKEFFFC